MVAQRDGQRIRRVIKLFFEGDIQDGSEHGGDLFFGGIAIAGHGLFYLFGAVFGDRNSLVHGSSDGNALRPAQFKHGLYILRIKRRFDGHHFRAVPLDNSFRILEDMLQLGRLILQVPQGKGADFDDPDLLVFDGDDRITHEVGAGIYAEDAHLIGPSAA